jgi:hypothetical protein
MTGDEKDKNRDRDYRNGDSQDEDLRTRFAELRREEELRVPQFAFPPPRLAGQDRRWGTGRLIAGAACVAALVAAALFLRFVPSQPARTGQPVATLTEWRSPTDFLLETPGRELLRSVPAIGVWQDYTGVSKPKQKHPQVQKQVLP